MSHVTEYKLTLKYSGDDDKTKELIYRGNENIQIRCTHPVELHAENIVSIEKEAVINFPRSILEKFIEMIQ